MRRSGPVVASLALAVVLFGCGGGPPVRTAADVTNPALSPAWSQWLVGPMASLATPEETRAYLALADDAAAQAFVEAFWERRDPDARRPGNPARTLFEARAAEADRRFSEAGYLGRRTARGTIWVLYGEPETIEFESGRRPKDPPVEVWAYRRDAGPGLDGRRPDLYYRFTKPGDLTVLYRPPEPGLQGRSGF